MSLFDKFRNLFKARNEEIALRDQLFITLGASFEHAKGQLTDENKIVPKIERLLSLDKSARTWKNAYEIERLLVEIYDDPTLDFEIGCKLIEAKRDLYESENKFYQDNIPDPDNIAAKRAFLSRLVNDLQWRGSIKETMRANSRAVHNLTALVFILSIIPFFLVVVYLDHTRLYHLYVAIASGIWGASFSMLISLKDRINESNLDGLRVQRGIGYMLSRPTIGLGAASILYYFLRADLLQGSMFPDMSQSILDAKNFSLLIVWSFLAGFSEKFIPNLLSKTEQKAESAVSS